MNLSLQGVDIYDDIVKQIQAQYRNTNIAELIEKIIDIKKRYILGAYTSLIRDNISITTAKGDGLDLWGQLLGFYRYVLIDSASLISYTMTDDEFRSLLVCIFQKQFIKGDIISTNAFVNSVFTDYGEIEVLDTDDMSYQIFVFNQKLPSWFNYCLQNRDILPRPAGVGVNIQQNVYFYFGFEPDDSDKDTNPTAYNERVAWFNQHINNFDNSIFRISEVTETRKEWFNKHVGAYDYTIFEDYEKGEYIMGFEPEPEDL